MVSYILQYFYVEVRYYVGPHTVVMVSYILQYFYVEVRYYVGQSQLWWCPTYYSTSM